MLRKSVRIAKIIILGTIFSLISLVSKGTEHKGYSLDKFEDLFGLSKVHADFPYYYGDGDGSYGGYDGNDGIDGNDGDGNSSSSDGNASVDGDVGGEDGTTGGGGESGVAVIEVNDKLA